MRSPTCIVPARIICPPNPSSARMVEYITSCMAGMFRVAMRKAFSEWVRRLSLTVRNFSTS